MLLRQTNLTVHHPGSLGGTRNGTVEKQNYTDAFHWRCRHTWRQASVNTLWCLRGCSIGDLGTIAYFQYTGIPWPVWAIMALAICNGLLTSIVLETLILLRQMTFNAALKTAIGMSLISMIGMPTLLAPTRS